MTHSEQTTNHDGISHLLNMLGLLAICSTLLVAFYYQLFKSELPCPLCLLQRVGLILSGCGFLMNMRFGTKGTHYALIIIGSILTGLIAVRQVFLHILPHDVGYGSTFLGLHFYTWALVTSILTILAVAVMLIIGGRDLNIVRNDSLRGLSRAIGILFALLVTANLISTVLECGTGHCDDNPTKYELLEK